MWWLTKFCPELGPFRFGWKYNAGLICFSFRKVSIHIVVAKDCWHWGRDTEEYEACLEYFGLGPLLLIAWEP